MELLNAVNQHCDIRRMKSQCNFGECGKKPGKEMLIFQLNMKDRTKKNVMSIYLCRDHFLKMEKNLEGVVNKFKEGKMYGVKSVDIGFVTF